jgi:hypothetical protein
MTSKKPQPKAPKLPPPHPYRGPRITIHPPLPPNNQAPDIDQWPVLWPLTEEDMKVPFGTFPLPAPDTTPPAGG